MLVIPDINPIAFEFFSLKIYWYGLSYFFGIIIGLFFIKKLDKKYNLLTGNDKLFDGFVVHIGAGILLGGRIGYVLFYNLDFYLDNLSEIIKIWHGGMSFHGALIGLIVSIYIFAKKNNLNFFGLIDYIAFVAPIGIFFGRLSNFVNKELIGRETNWKYGVQMSNGEIRHASQIYEAIGEGLILFTILLFAEYKWKILSKNGITASLFLIIYGIIRFFVEFVREPDGQIGLFFNFLTLGQLFCLIMVFGGLLLSSIQTRNQKLLSSSDNM